MEEQKQELQKNPGCSLRIPFLPQILVFTILLGSPSWYAEAAYVLLAILSVFGWLVFGAIFVTNVILSVSRYIVHKHNIEVQSSQPMSKETIDAALINIKTVTDKNRVRWWITSIMHVAILACIVVIFHQAWLVKFYVVFLLLHIATMHSIDELKQLIQIMRKQKFGAGYTSSFFIDDKYICFVVYVAHV